MVNYEHVHPDLRRSWVRFLIRLLMVVVMMVRIMMMPGAKRSGLRSRPVCSSLAWHAQHLVGPFLIRDLSLKQCYGIITG